MNTQQQRIAELEAWAAAEGVTLPMAAASIIAMEDAGAVVDLVTGAIVPGCGDQRVRLTVIGEAVAVAANAWNGGASC